MLTLTPQQRNAIVSMFPNNVRIPYEILSPMLNMVKSLDNRGNQTHNILCIAVPRGRRLFMWMHNSGTYLLEPGRNHQIGSIYTLPTTIGELSKGDCGTIVSGYICESETTSETDNVDIIGLNEKQTFLVDNVYAYNGRMLGDNIPDTDMAKSGYLYQVIIALRRSCCSCLLISVVQFREYDKDWVVVNGNNGPTYIVRHYQFRNTTQILPHYNVNASPLPDQTQKWPSVDHSTVAISGILPDNVRRIFHSIDATNPPIPMRTFKPTYQNIHTVFLVQADVSYDIYKLHCIGQRIYDNPNHRRVSVGECSWIFYQYALVPDLTSSIFMNTLFHNIRENENLDYIEESDTDAGSTDQPITQIPSNDDLSRKLLIECSFDWNRKQWIPHTLVEFSQIYRVPCVSDI